MAAPRPDLSIPQVIEAYARTQSVEIAARELRTSKQTVLNRLRDAGVKACGIVDERDIPPQHMPTFAICVAKVGRKEALRIIQEHIERRG